MTASQLERDLAARVDGEVRFDDGTRGAYSTDASNFRQVPIGVVLPRTVDAGAEAVSVCRQHGVPVLSRGGGTSLAGQCTNAGVVIDWSKYCHRVLDVQPDDRTCTVEPGIVLDVLNKQLAADGLRYGPEPATHMNCTIGGMIGNNSCGATAQRTGKVVDNIEALEVLLYDGTRFWCGKTSDEEYQAIERRGDRRAQIYRSLRRLRDTHQDQIKAQYPDIPRRVSGYNLDSLLPQHGFDVAGLLVGSESTLVTVLRAKLKLVTVQEERSLVVLGYPSVDRAADAVPKILPHKPVALEGLDHRLIHDEQIKHMNPQALAELPAGAAFLMVQFGGDTRQEVDDAAKNMLDDLHETEHEPTVSCYDDPEREDELWSVREAGLGATAHVPGHSDTFEGWEDSAVHPDRLGDYLRDLRRLYDEFGYTSDAGPSLYGHFGQGCVHTRIPFGLYSTEGVADYRRFMERAADLVASYDGSLSGEHGDGQSRGELLVRMFGRELVDAFGELKAIFDPGNRMNPGKVVHPAKLDEHLRLGGHWAPRDPQDTWFRYPDDGGLFAQAANRCVGVGKCRQHTHKGGAVMCPSYQVTHEEEHSTRGRARMLYEMLRGEVISDGWQSKDVHQALDLCLACKGCTNDCPVNVDMPTYKAEFLHHHYDSLRRWRPRYAYAFGFIDKWARLGSLVPELTNFVTQTPGLSRAAKFVAGIDKHRPLPTFAPRTLQSWYKKRGGTRNPDGRPVVLFPDTFNNHLHTDVGVSCVEALEASGWRVIMPEGHVCCGRPLYDYGFLDQAERYLNRNLETLRDHIRAGTPIVGIEPSCLAVFKDELVKLLPHDDDAKRLAANAYHFGEFLRAFDVEPPRLDGEAMLWGHCHHRATGGVDTEQQVLEQMGLNTQSVSGGCCGLAGSWGFEDGKWQISLDCGEQAYLPAIRKAGADTLIVANGFSCQTQLADAPNVERTALHLGQVLRLARQPQPHSAAARRLVETRPRPTALLRAMRAGCPVALAAAGSAVAARLVRR
jgi:FAD/FMN-containing dehydrogenase/Fe-S oxidoreductase